MGIEIVKPTPGELLYHTINAEAHKLTLGERLSLFAAMKNRRAFAALDPKLRASFERCARLLEVQIR